MDRLLILSDDPLLNTGLARCAREVAERFKNKYELAVAGWHHSPLRHSLPYHIYPLAKGDPQENQHLAAILNDFKPNKLLCIGDIWDFAYLDSTIWEYRSGPNSRLDLKAFLWTTPDGEWTDRSWETILRSFDRVASFSKFGTKEIQKLAAIDCPVIYPGVNSGTFFRPDKVGVDEKSAIDPTKTFVLITVAQNTSRKNLPAALTAFAELVKVRPNSHYVVVTDPNDAAGFHLFQIANWLGLLKTRKISFIQQNPRLGIPDEKLNWAYIFAHTFVLPSIGEGAGLPLFEAMAAQCVPIGTDYSAISEVIGDRGLLAEPAEFIFGAYGVRRAIVSTKSLFEKMLALHDDWASGGALRQEFVKKGLEFAKTYSWDKTSKELFEWIETPISEPAFVHTTSPKRKEICMVIPTWNQPCGIAEYTKQLSTALEKNGKHVIIYPDRDLTQLSKLYDQKPFGALHIQHEFSFFPDKFLMEKALDQFRKMGVKIVVTMHSAVRVPVYNQMMIRMADRIILHSESLQSLFLNDNPNIPENVRIVPMGCGNPMSLNGFIDMRKELGIAERQPIIGSFGFLRDQKGFHEIALAVEILKNKYPNILFFLMAPKHVFGHNAYDDKFFNFIRNRGLEQHVMVYREYLPEEQLVQTLQCADLFIMNYADAPQGGGISAAIKTVMRTQRPIIATKTLPFSDLKDEVAWVDQRDPNNLALSVLSILTNPGVSSDYVRRANEYLDRHNWDRVAVLHDAIYQG